ncbi:MAG: hypothetical protein KBS55_05595 [Bacteroidales bacterium]|nr:hypothetical protein [Candidatus Cryptobacteroides aphodequi]
MEQEKTKKSFGLTLKNAFIALIQGELLLRLNIGKYFLHIVLVFALIAGAIWASLLIDKTMTIVENNNEAIEYQQYQMAVKTFRLEEITRRSAVEAGLGRLGSPVHENEMPATVIENDTK